MFIATHGLNVFSVLGTHGDGMHFDKVLLACYWRVFVGHNIDERLEGAYNSFRAWCVAEKKQSSLKRFDLKTFKMSSYLGLRTCMREFISAASLDEPVCV